LKHGLATAWLVHALTASGAVWGLLAIDAVNRGNWREALLWLFVALVVDGIDGTLARAFRVRERLPRIDGSALDLIIDYLNYVLIPTFLIWRAGFLPDAIALALCAAILLSSLYVFARRDMKTEDGYFRGFPALWNVVAFYFVLATPPPWLAAWVVITLIALTFAPLHVVHPFRAPDRYLLARGATVVWGVSTLGLALSDPADGWRGLLLGVSLVSLMLLGAIGLLRTARGAERREASS
jgi:phosphatidylcholine synthase